MHQTIRRLNKKFRFQLLQEWLTNKYEAVEVLDVGGGKGLLSFFLNNNGWQATVVDPVNKDVYLTKYKDLKTGKRVLLKPEQIKNVPRIKNIFHERMALNYKLIIGLHTHGANLQIIDACKKYDKDFVLLPCCVIDEPLEKKPNINWLDSLIKYAEAKGFEVKKTRLNFKGQNIVIYTDKNLQKIQSKANQIKFDGI